MSHPNRTASLIMILFTALLVTTSAPRAAHAEGSSALLALAGPLAHQFGVSPSAVTNLLNGGLSIESVAQLLLVSDSSGKDLSEVKGAYDKANGEITDTANQFKVAAADYSPDKVKATINEATAKAKADAAEDATKAASDATAKAAGAANDAVGNALGGFGQ